MSRQKLFRPLNDFAAAQIMNTEPSRWRKARANIRFDKLLLRHQISGKWIAGSRRLHDAFRKNPDLRFRDEGHSHRPLEHLGKHALDSYRTGHYKDAFPENLCDPPDGVAKTQFFGTDDSHCLPR